MEEIKKTRDLYIIISFLVLNFNESLSIKVLPSLEFNTIWNLVMGIFFQDLYKQELNMRFFSAHLPGVHINEVSNFLQNRYNNEIPANRKALQEGWPGIHINSP